MVLQWPSETMTISLDRIRVEADDPYSISSAYRINTGDAVADLVVGRGSRSSLE